MKIEIGTERPANFNEYWPGQYEIFSHFEYVTGIPHVLFAVTTFKENGLPNVNFHSWSSFQGDGDTVTVTAENFAKSVSVETENGVLRLDDNFVDMEAGTKTFRILPTADFTAEGTGVSGAYRVRSVYETAER